MTNTIRRAVAAIGSRSIHISPLALIWLAALAAMPVTQWVARNFGVLVWVYVGALLQASLVVWFIAQDAGARRAVRVALVTFGAAWFVEALGSRTGFPFGAYHYTGVLQPQLLHVPLLIPLAWLMMLPPAWAVSQRLTGRRGGAAFVVVSALAFTAWDLFLDPQMTHWGLWVWDTPGAYFGVPLVNFAGWLLASAAITVVARPPALPGRSLLVVYTLVWLIQTVGQVVFWQLYGPAAWGFVGMGILALLAWRAEFRRAGVTSNIS